MLHLNLDDSPTRERQKINTSFSMMEDMGLFTGFLAPNYNRDIGVTYNATTRKVTLDGSFKAYFKGSLISELTDGWESIAHVNPLVSTPTLTGYVTYYLKYTSSGFVFDGSIWDFDDVQIASVQLQYTAGVLTRVICLREPHGSDMSPSTHKQLHYELGTGRVSIATSLFSNIVVNSTTAANRRPYISNVRLSDEDLETDVQSLSTNSYAIRYLTGSTPTRNISTSQTDIVKLSGNTPKYNLWNGSTWTDADFPNNDYGAIFVMAVPAAKDTASQSVRYMFIQPQQTGTLATIQALTPANLVLGESESQLAEYNMVGKIIIRYTANNWVITSYQDLVGNKVQQLMISGGGGSSLSIFDVYPVGSIYMSVLSTSPATLFGGTWEAWAEGRVAIGMGSNGTTNYTTVESEGGAQTHTHTSAAHTHTMGSHTHTAPDHYHDLSTGWAGVNQTTGVTRMSGRTVTSWAATEQVSGGTYAKTTATQAWGTNLFGTTNWKAQGGAQQTGTPSTNTTDSTTPGATGSGDNRPHYITCYMWKRTA